MPFEINLNVTHPTCIHAWVIYKLILVLLKYLCIFEVQLSVYILVLPCYVLALIKLLMQPYHMPMPHQVVLVDLVNPVHQEFRQHLGRQLALKYLKQLILYIIWKFNHSIIFLPRGPGGPIEPGIPGLPSCPGIPSNHSNIFLTTYKTGILFEYWLYIHKNVLILPEINWIVTYAILNH